MKIGNIINRITSGCLTEDDMRNFQRIKETVPGWSTPLHMAFFKACIEEIRTVKEKPSVLVCGVYHGMDLALIEAVSPGPIDLVGVDLFSAEPCADWPEEKRGMTWEQAFGCAPPSMEAAKVNAPRATVAQGRAAATIREFSPPVDLLFLDTSHDYQTVLAEIDAAMAWLRPTLIAGDDWDGSGGYIGGVSRAVDEWFSDRMVLSGRIWLTKPSWAY